MPKIQNEEMSQFSIRVPKKLKEKLFALAALNRRSAAQQITVLLENSLDKLCNESENLNKNKIDKRDTPQPYDLGPNLDAGLHAGKAPRLESLGLRRSRREASFDDNLLKIKAYKDVHGNCQVPYFYKLDISFGYWVSRIHSDYRNNRLSPEKITKLESLGIVWKLQSQNDEAFEINVSKLINYKKEFGDYNVPRGYYLDPALGRWVSKLREKYKTSRLSKAKIAQLEKLGFQWELRPLNL